MKLYFSTTQSRFVNLTMLQQNVNRKWVRPVILSTANESFLFSRRVR